MMNFNILWFGTVYREIQIKITSLISDVLN